MKRSFAFIISLALMLAALASLTYAESTGLAFSGSTYCTSEKALGATPCTIELVLEIAPDTPDTAFGTLVSTKGGGADSYFELQIRDGGFPAILWKTKGGEEQLVNFTQSNVDLRNWGKAYLTVTVDGNKVTVYNSGDEARSRADKTLGALSDVGRFMVGNNFNLDRALTGATVYSLAIFSGVRTSAQIKADMNGVDLSDPTLLACYDLTSVTDGKINDRSSSLNHLSVTAPTTPDEPKPPVITDSSFFKDKTPVTGYDYSFAVLGDTQIVSRNDALNGTKDFDGIYNYILNNISSKKIGCVIGVGDIMDNKKPEVEWPNVKRVIATLTNRVPYVLARGNHDSRGWFEQMNREPYATQIDGKNGNDIATAYKKITLGGIKYLIMSLDYGITDAGLEWANGVIAANPDHNVIITTHGYMESDGSITDENGEHPVTWNHEDGNNGVDIWDKLIRKHKNIVLVLCGHISSEKIVVRTDKGDNGNIVTSMLIDNQNYENKNGSMGFITMLYFSEGGSKVEVECYSTVMDAYYKEENQFSISLDVVSAEPPKQTTESSSEQQTTPDTTFTDKDTDTSVTESDSVTDTSDTDTSVTESDNIIPSETDSDVSPSETDEATSADETDPTVSTEKGSADASGNGDGGENGNGRTATVATAVAVIVIGIATVTVVLVTRKKKK